MQVNTPLWQHQGIGIDIARAPQDIDINFKLFCVCTMGVWSVLAVVRMQATELRQGAHCMINLVADGFREMMTNFKLFVCTQGV